MSSPDWNSYSSARHFASGHARTGAMRASAPAERSGPAGFDRGPRLSAGSHPASASDPLPRIVALIRVRADIRACRLPHSGHREPEAHSNNEESAHPCDLVRGDRELATQRSASVRSHVCLPTRAENSDGSRVHIVKRSYVTSLSPNVSRETLGESTPIVSKESVVREIDDPSHLGEI